MNNAHETDVMVGLMGIICCYKGRIALERENNVEIIGIFPLSGQFSSEKCPCIIIYFSFHGQTDIDQPKKSTASV